MDIAIKNSRILIGLLIGVALLFLVVGAGFFIAFITGSFTVTPDKIIVFIIFEFFAIGVSGVIFISQIMNMINPFVMLTTSNEGISFGTGFRYTPYTIPWKYIKSAEVEPGSGFPGLSQLKNTDNLIIVIEPTLEIPASLATSAGIGYFNYVLRIDGLYSNTAAYPVAESINAFLKNPKQ